MPQPKEHPDATPDTAGDAGKPQPPAPGPARSDRTEAAPRDDGKIAVRLSIQPDRDHYVHPGELRQLRTQGLLIENGKHPRKDA